MGYADIEVAIDEFQGTFLLKNAFSIQPQMVTDINLTASDTGLIEVKWSKVKGVDGYILYRSQDGIHFDAIKEVSAEEETIFQDIDMSLNSVYTYRVTAFKNIGDGLIYGKTSNTVRYNTPLAIPVINSVKSVTYNSLQINWGPVDGAVGYHVFRAQNESGPFEQVATIESGTIGSFLDATCESATDTYYYVIACQSIDGEIVLGDRSEVKSGRTVPNRVGLSGNGTSTEISLSWKSSTGAQGYEVYRSVNGGSYELVATLTLEDGLYWTERGLDKHTSYTYRIRPFCEVNGRVLYGSYSGTYEKEAVIVFDYSGEMGMDILRQYVGRPYVYGGQSPTKGWDCSYFVKWTFATHFGVELPRTAVQQSVYGVSINVNDRTEWEPGDLIFYRDKNGKGSVAHVAVYLGNGQMIHALSKKRGTLIQSVDEYETWDENKIYCVKRIFE
jgi:cell wall-associated NlpC family hydrolase